MTAIRATVATTGMLCLPDEIRSATGLERGGDVVVEFSGGDRCIRWLNEMVRTLQTAIGTLVGSHPEASVAAFLAHRRCAAYQE